MWNSVRLSELRNQILGRAFFSVLTLKLILTFFTLTVDILRVLCNSQKVWWWKHKSFEISAQSYHLKNLLSIPPDGLQSNMFNVFPLLRNFNVHYFYGLQHLICCGSPWYFHNNQQQSIHMLGFSPIELPPSVIFSLFVLAYNEMMNVLEMPVPLQSRLSLLNSSSSLWATFKFLWGTFFSRFHQMNRSRSPAERLSVLMKIIILFFFFISCLNKIFKVFK